MENKTEFNLNTAVAFWCERVASSSAFTPADVRELETHLKDSIGKLQSTGLSIEESFQIATQRLGSIESLTKEFAKINAPRVWVDRALWMAVGLQIFMLANTAAQTVAMLFQTFVLKLQSYGLVTINDGSVSGMARTSGMLPIIHWIVLAMMIGYVGKIAVRSSFNTPRWLALIMLSRWVLCGSLMLLSCLLSFSARFAQQLYNSVGAPGSSAVMNSYWWSWQYFLFAILYISSVPLALVWILHKHELARRQCGGDE